MPDRLSFIRNLGKSIADPINPNPKSNASFGVFVNDYCSLRTYIPVFTESYQTSGTQRVMSKAIYLSLLSNEESHNEILKGYGTATIEHPIKSHNISGLPFMPLDAKALAELERLVTAKKHAARYSIDVTDAKDRDILDFGYRTNLTNDKLEWWAKVYNSNITSQEELSFLQTAVERMNVAAGCIGHIDKDCLHPIKL